MKRYVLMVMALLMMVLCGGCGGDEQYVIDRPSVMGMLEPSRDSKVYEKFYQDELIEVVTTEEKNGEKWFKVRGGAYILAEECSKDEERVKQAKKVKEEMDKYIGKLCTVLRGDHVLHKYPADWSLDNKVTGTVFDEELFEIKDWKKIDGEIWFFGNVHKGYDSDDCGWTRKEGCVFDESQVKQIKESIDKAVKEQKEYAKNNPVTAESWTKTEDMLSFVYVEVTNNTDKEQQAIVEVKFYQDGVYLGKLMNLDTVEPHGKWRTKFLANTFVTGNYTYKVELKKDILD
ncbi:MAG: hypothetical protein IIX92_05750 [Selenomonadales bacterium]|nr:hypothetical protein [Selenomonadales bacterium]MBQ5859661.1 hypothetical protein [Selenomonadales bacterium]